MPRRISALVIVALALAVCGCATVWEPRKVSREQSEAELNLALEDAEAAVDAAEIEIAGRDIWAVAADAVLTAHPGCASVVGSGWSSYERAGMGVIEGLDNSSPLPADIADGNYVEWYGDPDRVHIDEQRIVLLWLLPERQYYPVMVVAEFVPESDGLAGGPEVGWDRTARIAVSSCYDAAGEELAHFDRAALPPLDLSKLDGESAMTGVSLRVFRPGECGEIQEVTATFEWGVLDENAPEYSGVAEGSDPTPAMLRALEDEGGDPDDFELWYVVSPRRALFASLDDREPGSTLLGQVAELVWLGFNEDRVPIWGAETSASAYLTDCERE